MSENPTQVTRTDDEQEPNAAPTIVVIKSNGRSLSSMLLPPAVIMILALAILSYQKQTPIRSLSTVPTAAPNPRPSAKIDDQAKPAEAPAIVARLESRAVHVPPPALPEGLAPVPTSLNRSDTDPASGRGETKSDPTRPREVDPLLARRLAMRTPLPGEDPPSDESAPSPEGTKPEEVPLPELDPLPLVPPDDTKPAGVLPQESPAPDPAPAPSPAPVPKPAPAPKAEPAQPKVTKEQVEADIKREAAKKEQELREMEKIKPPRRIDQIEESRREAQQKRAPFHADLRKLIKLSGKAAGPQIEALCDQYGRSSPQEIRDAVTKTLKRTHGGLSRQARVEMMRRLGLPEPNILEYFANDVYTTMNTPSGPKDPDEVWVYAARLLLAYPVNTPRKAAAKGSSGASASNPPQRAAAPTGSQARGRAK